MTGVYKRLGVRLGFLGLSLAILLSATPNISHATSSATTLKNFDLMKSAAFEVSGYPEAKKLPHSFSAVNQVVSLLDESRQPGMHLEVIRRAYQQLPPNLQNAFVQAVDQRHRSLPEDTLRNFDQGIVQWVFRRNKTGLFFLRKVNDKLNTPFTNLAYAMAQAEADILSEKGSPETINVRKMDVTYKLMDAVTLDAKRHAPGFWSCFVKVLDGLAVLPAYDGFLETDFTQYYVPYGKRVMPEIAAAEPISLTKVTGAIVPGKTAANKAKEKTKKADKKSAKQETVTPATSLLSVSMASDKPFVANSCPLSTDSTNFNFSQLYQTVRIDVNHDGLQEAMHFFYTDQAPWYRVAVMNRDNALLADFRSPISPYIMEDLNDDGTPELVIRQLKANPKEPVQVYRYQSCGFKLDESVASYFRI